jgi:hypothetical protein
MNPVVFVPWLYESRYALLGAMAAELADAFRDAGCNVNPESGPSLDPASPALLVFLNFRRLEAIPDHARRPGTRLAVIQLFVDHPLALAPDLVDAYAALPAFRMLLPCVDGLHWLRQRWPALKHAPCLHAVPRSALCDPASIAPRHERPSARDADVLAAGSIHARAELDAMRQRVPAQLHKPCDEMVELLFCHPWLSFEQALDAVLGPEGVMTGLWPTAAGVFRYVSAELNRRRRVSLVRAMQGLDTLVLGGEAWREFCTGTIRFGGDAPYAELPARLARARVCLAWGPTQFTQSFSERILLSLASGCATIADDRLLVRKHFDRSCARLFDAADPDVARGHAEALLKDQGQAVSLGAAGRALVESRHLWAHRLPLLGAVASQALAA